MVAVFGSSRPKPGSLAYQTAYELGQALGRAGFQVANGGYGGTMAAVSRGAREQGARVIGVTCRAFGRSGPNQWLDEEICTSDLNERLQRLIGLGAAYLVLPGGTGTLVELALCWELINKGFLPERPIICLSDYWKAVIDTIVRAGENHLARVQVARDCQETLAILSDYFRDHETDDK